MRRLAARRTAVRPRRLVAYGTEPTPPPPLVWFRDTARGRAYRDEAVDTGETDVRWAVDMPLHVRWCAATGQTFTHGLSDPRLFHWAKRRYPTARFVRGVSADTRMLCGFSVEDDKVDTVYWQTGDVALLRWHALGGVAASALTRSPLLFSPEALAWWNARCAAMDRALAAVRAALAAVRAAAAAERAAAQRAATPERAARPGCLSRLLARLLG